MKRYSVRPGKGASKLAFFVSIGMTIIGLVILVLVAAQGEWFPVLFMIVWLGTAIGTTIFHGKNAFGEKGSATNYIEVADEESVDTSIPFDEKLRKLEALKNEGILTQAEYDKKRKEIINDRW